MKTLLNKLPKEVRDLICLAGRVAAKNNVSAYLVGGFVRDLILGAKNLDLDIVVEGEGIKFAQSFAKKLNATITCHPRFGTATVSSHHLKLDIATARREVYPKPAQLPVVTPGNIQDDLLRRDFTINAMAISINQRDFGRSVDFCAGKSDLAGRRIRILHALSFIDDPTRILRAIRFSSRYNFKIEPLTLRRMKEALSSEMLECVEPQRIRDEIILILKEGNPLKPIRQIEKLAGFSFINSHLTVSKKMYLFLRAIQKQIQWFNRTYPRRRPLDGWLMYFIGAIDCLNKNEVRQVCNKFVFRRGEEKRIMSFKKAGSLFIKSLTQKEIKPAKIFKMLEPLSYEVILLLKAKYKNPNLQDRIKDFFEIYNGMRLFISGQDLMRLGVSPGPYYQRIFSQVLTAKLNGRVKTKKEELEMIKELIR